ncbi:DUF5999 family protein [Streptomyces albidoflavus]|uniref:DUF5999 family protein n=1 Tax=Streptomyces albidoflavus TaxID=1886 RepID=UPI002B27833C|nr:DUF5999 family protein [Streptomyces albidoflavus]
MALTAPFGPGSNRPLPAVKTTLGLAEVRDLDTGSPTIEVVSLTVPPPMIRQPAYHTWARSRVASLWPMRTHQPVGVVHWYAHPATLAHAFSLHRETGDPSHYLPRPEPEQRLHLLRQIDYLRHLITLGKLEIRPFPAGTEASPDADGVTLYHRHRGLAVLAHDIGPSVREIADLSRPDVLGWLEQIREAAGPPEEGAELLAEQYRAMCKAVCGPGWRCPHKPRCPDPAAPDAERAELLVDHSEQGWGRRCNGVISFADSGRLGPGGQVVAPHRPLPRTTR